MIFWILFICIVVLLFAQHGKSVSRAGNLSSTIGVIFIIVISGFRFDVGYDYFSYYKILIPHLHHNALERIEPFSKILFYVADFIHWPPMVFCLFSIFTYVIIFYVLKKYSHNYFFAVLTYIAFFYLSSIDTIRQGLAIGIIIYAYRYLIARKWKSYLICCIIAYLFHKAAIICVAIPLIYNYFNLKRLIAFIIVTSIVYKSATYALSSLLGFEHYIHQAEELSGGAVTKYVFLVINVGLIWFTRNKGCSEIRKLVYVTTVGAIFPFILGGHLGGRLSWFFLCYICFIIPEIINKFDVKRRRISAIFLCLYFIVNVYVTTLNKHKTPFTPYQTVFQIDIYNPHFKAIKKI